MSEQIREQVSAFLDGELPSSETELLLKRLMRDAELRESFGRYALIGESMRGTAKVPITRGFAARINGAIDGEPATAAPPAVRVRANRWWRPFAGAAVAAGVAAVAIVGLQQRAVEPALRAALPVTARNAVAVKPREAHLLYGAGRHARSGSGAAGCALDELRIRAQQILLRLGTKQRALRTARRCR